MFIHDIFVDKWSSAQVSTQYQGKGSSHRLAALSIIETIKQSLYHTEKPILMLFLDASSANLRSLYLFGMDGNSLLYFNYRFLNKPTAGGVDS